MSKPADPALLLRQLKMRPVSGERLAKKLGISRPAIWKQIRGLQELGFPIRSVLRRGYVLEGIADFSLTESLPLAAALKPWARIHHVLRTSSTQTLAKRAALGGVPEGYLSVAELQTQGRGRLGRVWSSGFGGLWFSLVLRPQAPPSRVSSIGLVAALQLAQAIAHVTGIQARLKWPNDILVPTGHRWKKVAGFLTEMSGEADKTDWVVMGIGVNVFNSIPKELDPIAASLYSLKEEESSSYSRAQLLNEFLLRFLPAYRLWQRKGFAPFKDLYWQWYARPDRAVRLHTADEEVIGTVTGVDDSGAIIIESRRKKRTVLEGEIVL